MCRGMLKLVLPSYVWLNQRCQRPCPNAALQAWLPVLPKNTLHLTKCFMSFYFLFVAISQLSWLMKQPNLSMKLHLWSRTRHQRWLKWLPIVVNILFIIIVIIIIIIALIYKNENPMVCLLALWVYKCLFFPKDSCYTLYKRWIFHLFFMH